MGEHFAIAALKLKRVVGDPCAENMPSASAYRPGDIVVLRRQACRNRQYRAEGA